MPGTPTLVAPSSEAELLALRRKCARALWALVPGSRSAPRSGGGGGGSTIAGTGGGQPSGSSSSAASYPPGPGLAAAGLTDSSVQKATAALMTQRTGAAKGFTHGHDTRATTPVPHTDSVTDHGEDVDGDDEEVLAEIERGILDVFSDAYCNKHLVYAVVELVLIRLLPEMAEKGVVELWAERIA
ncbi:hypothetical protein B0T25DRAFT_516868 [Lasiosphaeria hispida]|uniref:PXA domain-containing protein n=1 Tax=Lasiosphaeria hispida TaxID=260671 RepID=A0AAJ0MG52_9PEZI|nr:hypothetical protein B0T25DRAFT_516868 [Lasiosphaeria hispida]